MATTRLMPLHVGKGRNAAKAIREIIGYVENPEKTRQGELVTGYACDPFTADAEFLLAKRAYLARTGRTRGKDDVIAYHLRQSFVPGEITPEEANRIGRELARRFTHGDHAYIVATHNDKSHVHNHIIIHAVNLDCDRKFRNFWGSTKAVRQLSDTICIENGLSVVENPQQHGKSYNKWLGEKAAPSQRAGLRAVIDEALQQKPKDFEALLALVQAAGCEVKRRGESVSLRRTGEARFKRLASLGAEYDEAALRAVLSGVRAHTPRANQHPPQIQGKMNLLLNIQEKLREGKGPGFERWAKVYNLKQMAQTVNFLTENGLLEYGELKDQAEEAATRCNELSEKIKFSERRLTEIAGLKTQIINYIKTREVYIAYRQAGYSKTFLAEHEADILLHKAAKKAFDELGVKKLPTVKSLQIEYSALLTDKKHAYGEYRKARDAMRKLQTAKANVDRLLGYDDEHLQRSDPPQPTNQKARHEER